MENQAESSDEAEEGGGGPSIGELLTFLRTAPKRRRRAARIAFVVTTGLGIAVAILKPPIYSAEVRILAQRNGTLKDIATRSTREESPTKGASETILRRDNMIELVKDAKLVERWEVERSSIQRGLDSLMERFRAPPTEEDKIRALVGVLEKRLMVNADDMTITISASWSNAKTAYEIVTTAESRFVNTRRSSEVGMISDAIAILDTHLKTEREKLAQAMADVQRLEAAKFAGPAASAVPSAAPAAGSAAPAAGSAEPHAPPAKPDKRIVVHVPRPAAAGPDPERTKLLAEKRQRIAELDGDRQRQINDLHAQLTTLRGTLTPAHPSIVALERRLEIAKQPSEEVAALRAQAAQIEAELADVAPAPYDPGARGPDSHERDAGAPSASGPIVVVSRPDDDAETSMAKQKLTNALLKCDELQSRLRGARIELDVAEAAFKYKYSILTPAEVPRAPKKPSAAVIAIAGVAVAFILYFLIPAVLDLFSGRFIASWQAKKLGIPLLGELDPPS